MAYVGCIAGAVLIDDYIQQLKVLISPLITLLWDLLMNN